MRRVPVQNINAGVLSLLALALTTLSQAVAAPVPDKSHFNLLNPTPESLLRDLSTDRPDKTESAYTVDAGHFQLEMDVFSYAYDRYNTDRAHIRAEALSIAPVNLKLGLLNNLDTQLILPIYNSVRSHDLDQRQITTRSGFGDLVWRTKLNLWGNDHGATALAVMPWIKLPTNQDDLGNHAIEGGVIFPFALALPLGWGMGAITEFDVRRDFAGAEYHPEFINTIAFGHDIIGPLGGYVEFFSLVSTEKGSEWVGTVDLGLTYALSKNIQLDGGVNIGVTRSAPDINPFVGLSVRF
jgi:hypothetical protein